MSLLKYFKPTSSTDDDTDSTGQQPSTSSKRPQADRKKEYERTKRKRGFLPKWTKEFTWLEYDHALQLMYCRVCKDCPDKADTQSSFYLGCDSFRKLSIQTHDKSKSHLMCVLVKRAKENPKDTSMGKAIAKINASNFEILKKLFRTAYYVAKEEIALAKFPGLCKLQMANGVELKNTYINDHACGEFIKSMAHVQREKTTEELTAENTRFLSVLSDGSTDSGIIEQEIVYVRYLSNGSPETRMVKIVDVKHGHAAGILDAIDDAVAGVGISPDLWESKVICANFDGASVMMGDVNGVAGRLKRRIPHIVILHCVAHKLELAVLDAIKKLPFLLEFEETIKSVFKMYYYSPKKRRELKEIGRLIEEKVAHFSGLKSTRWVPSRLRSLKAIETNYAATIMHLENMSTSQRGEEAAKARGIMKAMQTTRFVKCLHFMIDYSTILAKCSEGFQHEQIFIGHVKEIIQSTTSKLIRLKTVPGESSAISSVTFYHNLLSSSGENRQTYKGVNLTNRRQSRLIPEAIPDSSDFSKVLDDTVKYLDARFANFDEEPLSCFDIFDISKLPHDRQAVSTYGDRDIEMLVKHFESVLTDDEIKAIPDEWSDLKIWMSAHRGVGRLIDLYGDLIRENPPHLSKVLVLLQVLLTLSPSTAACERGFSTMNRVKTCHRTSLLPDTLNNLMQISADGCKVEEYSPDKAVEHWFFSAKGTRHLEHKTPAKSNVVVDESESEEEQHRPIFEAAAEFESGSDEETDSDF
ncbi:zinc finger protein 862-like [Antedon mediterranea]|uniref:zinc finger protein 862-like n=1 Tax=Antedon mediterranea TaxID=105859 RepID=UPI003AF57011